MGHDHHHAEDRSLAVAVLTVSSSRDADTDESGDVATDLLEGAGHEVVDRSVVTDDVEAIRERVHATDVDVLVTTGGTGLSPDDVTVEALRPLFRTELPGFGEYFRRLSHEDVGTRAMLSRATAGVLDGTVVYALPGSPAAVRLGVEEAILPEVTHAVSLVQE